MEENAVKVSIAIASLFLSQIEDIEKSLENKGLTVTSKNVTLGIIEGIIEEDKVAELDAVSGVRGVQKRR